MTATSPNPFLTPARLLLALTPLVLQPPKAVQAAYCANFTFAAATNFGVGSKPYSVAVGDFNGDGHPDLASAIFGSNQVSVRLGNGDGTFAAATNSSVGTSPAAVAVGDFNGDGRLDLATANANPNTVSVLLGNGNGTFTAATNLSVGSVPVSVAVGDFNGDSRLDLATANLNSDNVSVLLGNGNGTFAAATNFGMGTDPLSLAVGDFNGDGSPDLATANAVSNNVSVRLGNGSGGFAAATNFGVGTQPYSVTVGDFNGDGSLDLASAIFGSNQVSVLLGNGSGGFAAATNFNVGGSPRSVTVGDFNHDSSPDLATANSGSNNSSVLLGDGSGGFVAVTNFSVGSFPSSVAVGDFNGDSNADLAVANQNSDNVSLLFNTCPASEIAVLGNNMEIADGDASPATLDDTDFGSIMLGGAITHTFTISNSGNEDLALTGSPVVSLTGAAAGDFTVVSQPTTPVAPGNTTTFQVRFNPSLIGTRAATVIIANDDGNENPYNFVIQGTGNPAQAGSCAGPDQSVAAETLVTLDGSGSSDPDGHTPLTYGWAQTGGPAVTLSDPTASQPTFTAPGLSTVLTFSLIVTDTFGLADPTPDEVAVIVTAPEMAVLGNNMEIADGDASPATLDDTDFGSVGLGEAITHTFTISNSGLGSLSLTGSPVVSLTGAAASDFTVVSQPTTLVAPGNTTTFQVRFAPTLFGTRATTVTIANTDSDKNPYDFALQGVGSNTAPAANAGPDQSVNSDMLVTLDGSGSSDPDGHAPLTYGWTQTGGPAVTLSDPTSSQPTFTAPGLTTVLTFSLVVTDAFGLADPTPDEVAVTVTTPEMAVMYVTNSSNNTVSRANLDSTGGVSLGNLNGTLNFPFAIALDVAAGKMYVTNSSNNTVSRANLDGTGGVNLGNLNGTLNGPVNIALDVAAGKMYVTNFNNDTVSRANLDGTGGVNLGNLGGTLKGSQGIALDVATGKMYIVNAINNTISQANLDGTGGVSLGNLNGTLDVPYGIALDLTAGKMYVANFSNNTISRANLDGTDGESLGNLNGTLKGPIGIALDVAAGRMYVVNYGNTTVSRANLDGTGGVNLGNLNGTLSNPMGLALGPAPAVPEMAVLGNNVEITDGDTTPTITDHTDFGSVALGGAITRTFTISNSGNTALALTGSPVVSLTGVAAGDFTVISQPATSVGAGNTTTFQVRFAPSIVGMRAVTVTIANTDSGENPYNFALQGVGNTAPEITVLGNNMEIADGDTTPATADHTDFGSVTLGGTITRTFTISNSGTANLTLTGSPVVSLSGAAAGDFTVVSQPATSVGVGNTTTFQVRFNPSVADTRAATLTIANTDGKKNPYNFALQGIGASRSQQVYLPFVLK